MLLCDIGNTTYHFFKDEIVFKKFATSFNPESIQEKVLYISVNKSLDDKLKKLDNWVDLSQFIEWNKYYKTMGIDRIFAIEAVDNCVVVDAGSALTVDVVREGEFQGGFIYPGKDAMYNTFCNISSALEYEFNFQIPLDTLPKNSVDALSYGYLKMLYSEVTSYQLPIILTGGDAKYFSNIFHESIVDEKLIFRGMQKVIEKYNL